MYVLPDIELNLNATRRGLTKYTSAELSVVEKTGEKQNRVDKTYKRIKNKTMKLKKEWTEEEQKQRNKNESLNQKS